MLLRGLLVLLLLSLAEGGSCPCIPDENHCAAPCATCVSTTATCDCDNACGNATCADGYHETKTTRCATWANFDDHYASCQATYDVYSTACETCSDYHYVDHDSCSPCGHGGPSGYACEPGQYKSGTPCGGSNPQDTQSCAECLNGGADYACPLGFTRNGVACTGQTTDDTQTCQHCHVPQCAKYVGYCVCSSCVVGNFLCNGTCCECGNGGAYYNCPSGQYRSGPTCSGEATLDTQTCEECVCPSGQYMENPCVNGAAPGCAACHRCPLGQYISQACDGTSTVSPMGNQQCAPCANCSVGFFLSEQCSGYSGSNGGIGDRACVACPPGCDECKGFTECDRCSPTHYTLGSACVPCEASVCAAGWYFVTQACAGNFSGCFACSSAIAGCVTCASSTVCTQYQSTAESSNTLMDHLLVYGVPAGLAVCVVLIAGLLMWWKRSRVTHVNENPINPQDVRKVKEIGRGASGVVYNAKWRGTEVAVKVPLHNADVDVATALVQSDPHSASHASHAGHATRDSAPPGEHILTEFRHEVAIMVRLGHHPRVVSYLGSSLVPHQPVMVLMELLVGGSVEELLASTPAKFPVAEPGLTNAQKLENWRVLVQLLVDCSSAMQHVHAQGIVHRDIAARNFLVDSNNRACIADFGMSQLLPEDGTEEVARDPLEKIPIKWCAPETLTRSVHSKKTDIYSFGIFLYETIAREEPYEGIPLNEVAMEVPQATDPLRPVIPGYCPVELFAVMRLCWGPDPAKRPTAEVVNERLTRFLSDLRATEDLDAVYSPWSGDDVSVAHTAGSARAHATGDEHLRYMVHNSYTDYVATTAPRMPSWSQLTHTSAASAASAALDAHTDIDSDGLGGGGGPADVPLLPIKKSKYRVSTSSSASVGGGGGDLSRPLLHSDE